MLILFSFDFDWFFAAYLLILAGGLGTTFCLWKVALGDTSPSHVMRRKVDYLTIDVKEFKEREREFKEEIKQIKRELYILKSEMKTLKKHNRE